MENPLRCFCCPSIFAQALRAAIVTAELPLRGKLRAEATTIFIDQRILEVMKKQAKIGSWPWRGCALGGRCIKLGGRFAAGRFARGSWPWRGCAAWLSGSLSWVAWHMYSVVQHVPHYHNSHTMIYLCSYTMMRSLYVFDSKEYLRRVTCSFL